MELRHLRYFVAVAEELNLTRASVKLHVAQPALSRQMRDLERELKATLFERSHSGVHLTRAGRTLYARAQTILAQATEAMHEARTVAGVISGRLAIGFPSGVTLNYLSPIVASFRRLHPTVELDFIHLHGADQIKALRDCKIDLAIAYLPFHGAEAFETQKMWRIPFKAVLPEKHELTKRRHLSLSDLRHEDFVFCAREPRPEFYDAFFRACDRAGFHPRVVKEVGGYLSNVVALVSVGQGVSVLPHFDQMERIRGVSWRGLTKPNTGVQFALFWRRQNESVLLRAFLQLAQEHFGNSEDSPGVDMDWTSI